MLPNLAGVVPLRVIIVRLTFLRDKLVGHHDCECASAIHLDMAESEPVLRGDKLFPPNIETVVTRLSCAVTLSNSDDEERSRGNIFSMRPYGTQ